MAFQLFAELFQLFGLFCQLFGELFQLFAELFQLLGELSQLLACENAAVLNIVTVIKRMLFNLISLVITNLLRLVLGALAVVH